MSTDANSPDEILGQEFLTWLWYRSDSDPAAFKDKDGSPFAVSLEQKITVEGGSGEERETAAVSGVLSPLREARVGLATGKKVTRALLQLSKDEMNFQVTLKAADFSCNALRTPKVEKPEEDDDPDAVFLEKVYLMETALLLLDCLYRAFLEIRLDEAAWTREVQALHAWTERAD